MSRETKKIHGLMAEFESGNELVEAIRKMRRMGFTHMDAYSPAPIEGLVQELGHKPSKIPLLVLIAGICGGLGGYLFQLWVSSVAYPLNVGGRPFNSWPSFMPVAFEMTILCAALTAVISMFALNGLPQPYHPVFNVKQFVERGSVDRYFLCVESTDPKFDLSQIKGFLQELRPIGTYEVDQ